MLVIRKHLARMMVVLLGTKIKTNTVFCQAAFVCLKLATFPIPNSVLLSQSLTRMNPLNFLGAGMSSVLKSRSRKKFDGFFLLKIIKNDLFWNFPHL